jgi:hypothetical protein
MFTLEMDACFGDVFRQALQLRPSTALPSALLFRGHPKGKKALVAVSIDVVMKMGLGERRPKATHGRTFAPAQGEAYSMS